MKQEIVKPATAIVCVLPRPTCLIFRPKDLSDMFDMFTVMLCFVAVAHFPQTVCPQRGVDMVGAKGPGLDQGAPSDLRTICCKSSPS